MFSSSIKKLSQFSLKWAISAAVLAVSLASALPSHAAVSPELSRLLGSSAGRMFLAETERGAEIAGRILGRRFDAAVDMGALLDRLGEQDLSKLSRKLEQSLARIEARYKRTVFREPNQTDLFAAGPARQLQSYERLALETLIRDEIRLDIRLFPAQSVESFNATRRVYEQMLEVRPTAQAIKRYPKGVNPLRNPGWNLQFGFESEYTLKETAKILEVYGPAPELGVSLGQWQAMRPEERMEWIGAHLRELFPSERSPGKLIRLVREEGFDFLPERLILDSTGNVEFVFRPVETLEEWRRNVTMLNERFGAGSMQGTMSTPADAFFARPGSREQVEEAVQSNLGYFNLMNDLDSLEKLEVGATRFAQDPTKEVARSFNHPFLGPINKAKQERLEDFVRANARNEKLARADLDEVSGSDASFKYIGGTAYRPDIDSPYRIILEVRDAHNNLSALTERMLRATFYEQFGRGQFKWAASLPAFDSVADYRKLSGKVQSMLERLFPAKLKPGVDYSEEEKLALQVYRNFAYPLRDWNPHLSQMRMLDLSPRVRSAQEAYVAQLETIAQELSAGTLTPAQASVKVQGALARFAPESGMAQAIRKWQSRNLVKDKSWNKYIQLAAFEIAPLQGAFPRTVWEGSLEQRIGRLVQKYSDRMSVVEGAKIAQNGQDRRVLVISTQGMSPQEVQALTRDYTAALARGTVSFPLSEGGGHLYTRMGEQTFDFAGVMSSRGYAGAHLTQRLEPVVALSAEEELRLRFYIENALRNPSEAVGMFHMNGAADARTGRTLRRNQAQSAPGHNCTSWLATAPIGSSNRQPLFELTGATADIEIHTNPGWWNYHLSANARADRVPVVVYWTPQPLAQAKEAVERGGLTQWNFARH